MSVSSGRWFLEWAVGINQLSGLAAVIFSEWTIDRIIRLESNTSGSFSCDSTATDTTAIGRVIRTWAASSAVTDDIE